MKKYSKFKKIGVILIIWTRVDNNYRDWTVGSPDSITRESGVQVYQDNLRNHIYERFYCDEKNNLCEHFKEGKFIIGSHGINKIS